MGFRKDAYATVWEVSGVSPTMTKGRISISRKDRNTGQYETDFSGFVSFIGSVAASRALGLKEKDRIKLGDIDVSTKYDREQNKEYVNYKVFSFENADEVVHTPAPEPAVEQGDSEPADDSELPF